MNNSEKHPSETQRDHEGSPFVSVIMNCYNSARYLREALESVRSQTYGDWEIVFWDNRSTDESASIFKSFNDTRFRYFLAPEHTILATAKKFAIEKARGEWLAFLDCDDLWLPSKLEKQVAIIGEEGPGLGLVYGRMNILIEEEARRTIIGKSALANNHRYAKDYLPEGNIFATVIKDNFVPQPSAMIRRSAYTKVGGVNPDFKHSWDFDIWVKVSKDFKARALQEVCCIYRVHGANLSHIQLDQCFDEAVTILGRYLPNPEVVRAIRGYHTSCAAYKMRQGHWICGWNKLWQNGDFILFARKFLIFSSRRLRSGKGLSAHRPDNS